MEEIRVNNKQLAEFIGFFSNSGVWDNKNIIKGVGLHGDKYDHGFNGNFHTNWNWLMPVIEHIESIGANVVIGRFFCQIGYTNPLDESKNFDIRIASGVKMNAVYDAALKFIKWYNQNEK